MVALGCHRQRRWGGDLVEPSNVCQWCFKVLLLLFFIHYQIGMADEVIVDTHGQIIVASVIGFRLLRWCRRLHRPMMHVSFDGCLIGSDVDVVVPAYGCVAVNQTLLYLLGLVRCQNQFGGIMYLWVASSQSSRGGRRICIVVISVVATIGLQRHVVRIHNVLGWQRRRVTHRPRMLMLPLVQLLASTAPQHCRRQLLVNSMLGSRILSSVSPTHFTSSSIVLIVTLEIIVRAAGLTSYNGRAAGGLAHQRRGHVGRGEGCL